MKRIERSDSKVEALAKYEDDCITAKARPKTVSAPGRTKSSSSIWQSVLCLIPPRRKPTDEGNHWSQSWDEDPPRGPAIRFCRVPSSRLKTPICLAPSASAICDRPLRWPCSSSSPHTLPKLLSISPAASRLLPSPSIAELAAYLRYAHIIPKLDAACCTIPPTSLSPETEACLVHGQIFFLPFGFPLPSQESIVLTCDTHKHMYLIASSQWPGGRIWGISGCIWHGKTMTRSSTACCVWSNGANTRGRRGRSPGRGGPPIQWPQPWCKRSLQSHVAGGYTGTRQYHQICRPVCIDIWAAITASLGPAACLHLMAREMICLAYHSIGGCVFLSPRQNAQDLISSDPITCKICKTTPERCRKLLPHSDRQRLSESLAKSKDGQERDSSISAILWNDVLYVEGHAWEERTWWEAERWHIWGSWGHIDHRRRPSSSKLPSSHRNLLPRPCRPWLHIPESRLV